MEHSEVRGWRTLNPNRAYAKGMTSKSYRIVIFCKSHKFINMSVENSYIVNLLRSSKWPRKSDFQSEECRFESGPQYQMPSKLI